MKAIIVDDEFMPAEYMAALLKRNHPRIEVAGVFTNALEAVDYLQQNLVDILFLDIEMPGLSGFELLAQLEQRHVPATVFTTAFNQYAVKAFEANAVHYLLKPVDPAKLKDAISRIEAKQDEPLDLKRLSQFLNEEYNKEERIALPSGSEYQMVAYSDIVRIEGSGSYSDFVLLSGKQITVSKRLKHFEGRLSKAGFIQTHQSHMVNSRHIDFYSKSDGGYVKLSNKDTVPVSQSFRQSLKRHLGLSV